MTINQQSVALSLKAAHTKAHRFGLSARQHAQGVQVRVKLAPQLCIGHRQHILASSHLGGLYRLSVKHKLRFFLRIQQRYF